MHMCDFKSTLLTSLVVVVVVVVYWQKCGQRNRDTCCYCATCSGKYVIVN